MTRTVAVTGAAGALGRTVVAHLRAAGWSVAAIDLGDPAHSDAALVLGGIDLADEAAMATAATRIAERFGQLDGLVNIAGGFAWETVVDGSPATWDRLYHMNVRTTLVATRALLPLLRAGGGAVVNIGAAAAAKAAAGMGAYAAAKSGVARLTEALAEEWKDERIRVNAILPSMIDTPANRRDMPDADFSRWVRTEELAAVVAFLLSPAAAPITGALIPVTGRV